VGGVPIGALGAGESEWHTDMSYMPQPPSASLLHALELPESGGDTWFCNMYAAYEALPPALRERLAGLVAVHDSSYTSAGDLRKGHEPVADVSKAPGARHPVIRTHPLTGRRALFLGRRRNAYLVGLDVAESERLLDQLWSHATQERLTYRHRWRVGDLVLWDNRCAMHRRDAFAADARRIMHRTQVQGDLPVYRAA
jgi:taurine dioxygenase